MSLNDWIRLNVGGQIFLTTRTTLSSCPGSTLSEMFNPDSALPPAHSENGVFFLDADPKYFSIILNWMRHRDILLDPGIDLVNVAKMGDYFGLGGLCEMIKQKKLGGSYTGKWRTGGSFPAAMTFQSGTHVISRSSQASYLSIVPVSECQKTLQVAIGEDEEIAWVEMDRGDIPAGAVRVGERKEMFVGKKYHTSGLMSVGYVSEEGFFRSTFTCTPRNCASVGNGGHCEKKTSPKTFDILCVI